MTKQETSEPIVNPTPEAGAVSESTGDGGAGCATTTIAELQAKIEKLEDALLRSKAEYQNFQRRSNAERQDAVRFANAELMKSLLNVLDDFERSLSASKGATLEAVVAGEQLVYENLLKALSDNGLEVIEAKGKPFDPTIHEALLHQSSEEYAPGTVMEQVARGYRLRERVLRPARVIVAKAASDVEEKSEAT